MHLFVDVWALIGLVMATAAQMSERHTILKIASVAICVAAITWQRLIAGRVVGMVIPVLLLTLRSLADVFYAGHRPINEPVAD